MRLVLSIANEGVPCLPFALEPHTRWFSEARLPTRFTSRGHDDDKCELATQADGVVGHFSFATDTKASLELNPDGSQFVVLEGKMFSKLRKDVKNAKNYDQVARSIGCMAESLFLSGKPPDQWKSLGFYLFAPQSQIARGIFSAAMEHDSVRKGIRDRTLGLRANAKRSGLREVAHMWQSQACAGAFPSALAVRVQSNWARPGQCLSVPL